jgi:hypothetical protein
MNGTTINSVNSNKEIDGGLISCNVTVYTIYALLIRVYAKICCAFKFALSKLKQHVKFRISVYVLLSFLFFFEFFLIFLIDENFTSRSDEL